MRKWKFLDGECLDFCVIVYLVFIIHLQHHDHIVPQSRSAIHPNCVDLRRRLQDSGGGLLSKHGHAGKQVGRGAEQGELERHS